MNDNGGMGEVWVRQYSCWVREDVDGEPYVHVDPSVEEFPLAIRIATMVRTNALATALRGPLRYATRRHELRLLLSYLDDPRGASLTLRDAEFRASALHIRRFVSESAGLGILTGVVEMILGWRRSYRRLANFDILPPGLARQYNKHGIRPDLLFMASSHLLAGEARARSSRPSIQVRRSQLDRLDDLLAWSQLHGDHPIVMTWAWVTEEGITVDLFDFPALRAQRDVQLVPRLSRTDAKFHDAGLPSLTELSEERGRRRNRRRPTVDEMTPDALFDAASETARQFEAQLFQTAPVPTSRQTLFDRPIRGEWVALDLFGPAQRHLFLGVLDAPPDAMPRSLS